MLGCDTGDAFAQLVADAGPELERGAVVRDGHRVAGRDLPGRGVCRGQLDLWLGPLWFLLKLAVILFVFMWLRATLPRLRYDQLMRLGWKVLLPLATINAVVTAALVVAL